MLSSRESKRSKRKKQQERPHEGSNHVLFLYFGRDGWSFIGPDRHRLFWPSTSFSVALRRSATTSCANSDGTTPRGVQVLQGILNQRKTCRPSCFSASQES